MGVQPIENYGVIEELDSNGQLLGNFPQALTSGFDLRRHVPRQGPLRHREYGMALNELP